MQRLVVILDGGRRFQETVRYACDVSPNIHSPGDPVIQVLLTVDDDADDGEDGAALARRVEDIANGADTPVETTVLDSTGDTSVESVLDALPADTVRVIVPPESETFTISRVSAEIETRGWDRTIPVERPPVFSRPFVRPQLERPRTWRRVAGTFAVAFGFYLVLGDPTKVFDVATGVLSACVVAAVLSGVAIESDPTSSTVGRVARAGLFLPYLLFEVVKANVRIAWIILHPACPVDPRVVRISAPDGPIAQTLLANSITLTPGTLTVDVVEDELVVHTLTTRSRDSLAEGSLVRAVDFVIHGRGRSETTSEEGED